MAAAPRKRPREQKSKGSSSSTIRGTCSPNGIYYESELRPTRARAFRDIVPGLIARYGIGRRMNNERLDSAWEQIRQTLSDDLSADIFDRITIRSFRGGIIQFDVPNNVLYQEILFHETRILAEFQQRVPDERIRKIKFTVKK